ncbi:DUF4056 domain-containing protein [Escherichia coli]|uniref:DUF4056 domain-containing protein n=2 Tax=Escherichia coli TaxID=562 RepID=A0A8S7IK38_ECOLX|nr:DUF4056 domain-containing protein [Escherichia coli]EFA6995956.1 DUF4056 domain-containing protein [Escherichia coli]EFB9701653.1 DUF4056 domain-containing protein [Escherichia coli]EFC2249511.1 DUF4056 domain-containing protein [Escherichia coli]EFD0877590.1 DUF4056 domain-containing protein [Escherichia coli]EFD0882891.1 DUF4056 domain-containing protein [Escherichia coli]
MGCITDRQQKIKWLLFLLLWCCQAQAVLPLPLWLDGKEMTTSAWPVMPPLSPPEGLRACCAFGYDLGVRVPWLRTPLPFFHLDNVVEAGSTGGHHYNDSFVSGMLSLTGGGREHNGIIFTTQGGFVDTAHVRDTADMTVFIFTRLWPRLGQAFVLSPGRDELAQRRLVFRAFTPPSSVRDRYVLAAEISARLAYQLAVWHEIAQWYGFESVPGYPETVSAFSPEDLWSNLLGARVALSLIFSGQTADRRMYETAMQNALKQVLVHLGGGAASRTRFQLRMLDRVWWNSRCLLPDKWLVIKRNYDVDADRLPVSVPGGDMKPLRLSLPLRPEAAVLAELQLWPGQDMKRLPVPEGYYTGKDFAGLASRARAGDSVSRDRFCP